MTDAANAANAGDAGDLYAAGRARADAGWRRVMQCEPAAPDAVPGSYPDLSNSILFGDLWQRPHLSVRERRLVVLTLLAAYGRDEPMAYHLHGALESGDLDADALHELVVHLAFYAGWPTSSTLFQAVERAVADRAAAPARPEATPGGPDT